MSVGVASPVSMPGSTEFQVRLYPTDLLRRFAQTLGIAEQRWNGIESPRGAWSLNEASRCAEHSLRLARRNAGKTRRRTRHRDDHEALDEPTGHEGRLAPFAARAPFRSRPRQKQYSMERCTEPRRENVQLRPTMKVRLNLGRLVASARTKHHAADPRIPTRLQLHKCSLLALEDHVLGQQNNRHSIG